MKSKSKLPSKTPFWMLSLRCGNGTIKPRIRKCRRRHYQASRRWQSRP